MNIVNGTRLGTAFPNDSAASAPLEAISFTPGGQLYVAQVIQTYPKQIIIRGRQLLLDANAEQGYSSRLSTIEEADLSVLAEAPDGNGFNNPTGFSTPDGWTALTDAKGTKYLENNADAKSAAGGDTDGDGVIDSPARSANFIDTAVDWVKANTWLAVGIVVVAYVLLKPKKTGRGRGKSILAGLLG